MRVGGQSRVVLRQGSEFDIRETHVQILLAVGYLPEAPSWKRGAHTSLRERLQGCICFMPHSHLSGVITADQSPPQTEVWKLLGMVAHVLTEEGRRRTGVTLRPAWAIE